MEQKIPNFFGEKGMTSTSANHLANIAKEVIQDKEAELAALQFYTKSVELIDSEKKVLQHGYTDLGRIKGLIEDIARMYAFCAWAREAIKRKDAMLQEIEAMGNVEYCQLKDIEMPIPPQAKEMPTAETCLDQMTVKERNEYYTVEAFAATYGKHIHPDGDVSLARANLLHYSKNPSEIQGNGRDAMVYTYEPSVTTEQLDKTFFELQSSYRETEARLNNLKAHIQNDIKKQSLELQNEYEAELEEYRKKIEDITNERKRYVIEQRAFVGNLKIVIPEHLRETYDYLNALGKENKNE